MLKRLEKSCDYISYIPEVEVIHRKDLKEKVSIISSGVVVMNQLMQSM